MNNMKQWLVGASGHDQIRDPSESFIYSSDVTSLFVLVFVMHRSSVRT